MRIPTLFSLLITVEYTFADLLCNGYTQLCNRSYGNVTFIGAHDSAFYSTLDVVLGADQDYDVTRQLDDGIRLLQSQGHASPISDVPVAGNIELCHTNCIIYDGGTLVAYLQKVKTWLDQNPNEVLTILFTNPDAINVTIWGADFVSSGIAEMAFVPNFTSTPPELNSWPTLGSMISSGKRVVIFMDYYANQTEVDFILDEFTYMWETPFDQTNSSFPCTVNRPPSLEGQIPKGRLSVINHFFDITLPDDILVPDRAALDVTNGISGAGSLGEQAIQCAQIYGAYPNFFLVDFYDVPNGSVFEVAATLNGVPYSVRSAATSEAVLHLLLLIQLTFCTLILGGVIPF
jgi:hypothetical protein